MSNGENLRSGWLSVASRMQQKACTENANAVLNINVLIDKSGNPIFWFEPGVIRIEPAARLSEAIEYMLKSRNNGL